MFLQLHQNGNECSETFYLILTIILAVAFFLALISQAKYKGRAEALEEMMDREMHLNQKDKLKEDKSV